ncbi:DUF2642 domain-containing protein [Terribacillus sp. DMT04]|uniref:DUF2642 domain-containing protein n=1 Tax=Terribacillus sp. DMT04 TaxID=2850441 RepID=UPI0020B6E540|nr:DUF2642 domain-containing protein [Terribacillus sp. DMT04]
MHFQTNQVTAEPYVFQLLQSLTGGRVVVESPGDSYRGILIDAKPDHIAIKDGDSVFYIRTMQIISVMPD